MTTHTRSLALLIAAAVFILFSPTIGHEFLRYDDEIYIYGNPRIRPLSAENVVWVFSNEYFQSYTPLTLLSHMVDWAVWGPDARGHHLMNVLLHTTNGVLLFFVILLCLRARGSRWATEEERPPSPAVLGAAAFGALVFALHPLRAESVAWVSDRKDLLLALFLLSSFIAYVRGWLAPTGSRTGIWRAVSVGLFLLAVLSKTTAVVFPLVLLMADVWWGRAARNGSNLPALVMEKWAFLLVSAGGATASAAATGDVKFHYAVEHLSTAERALLGLASPAFYFLHFLWPARLTPVYVVPEVPALALLALLTAGVTVLAAVPLLRSRRVGPVLVWLLFLAFLVPVALGLAAAIQPLADRYTYVPAMATGLAAAAGGLLLWTAHAGRTRRGVIGFLCAGLLVAWSALTIRQNGFWKDSLSLWTYARAAAPETGVMTLVPLGITLYYAGDADGAIAASRDAIRLEPRHVDAYYLLGLAYAHKGDLGSAAEAYLATLERDSLRHPARINLANIYLQGGRVDDALREYRTALRHKPNHPQALYNLGTAFEKMGRADSAEAAYEAAHRAQPGFLDPLVNLGVLRQRAGRLAEALGALETARALEPENASVNFNLGVTLEGMGRIGEAAEAYRRAIGANPDMLDPYINLAGLLARQGDLEGARLLYLDAATQVPDAPDPHYNLGILASISGDVAEAIRRFERAAVLDPRAPAPLYQLGLMQVRRGDSLSARQSMATAAALGSADAVVWLRAGGD